MKNLKKLHTTEKASIHKSQDALGSEKNLREKRKLRESLKMREKNTWNSHKNTKYFLLSISLKRKFPRTHFLKIYIQPNPTIIFFYFTSISIRKSKHFYISMQIFNEYANTRTKKFFYFIISAIFFVSSINFHILPTNKSFALKKDNPQFRHDFNLDTLVFHYAYFHETIGELIENFLFFR